jgi:Lon-like ATP-dependent protease
MLSPTSTRYTQFGVFAQITSVFAASGKDDDREKGLTAVLYPHRRIKITELLKAGESSQSDSLGREDEPLTPPPSPQSEAANVHPGTFYPFYF